jgi:hypothetical protein
MLVQMKQDHELLQCLRKSTSEFARSNENNVCSWRRVGSTNGDTSIRTPMRRSESVLQGPSTLIENPLTNEEKFQEVIKMYA